MNTTHRRTFLNKLNAGAAAIAAVAFGGGRAVAQVKSTAAFTPTKHALDDWMELPSQHRLVFDTVNPTGFGEALLFAGNYQLANRNGYSVEAKDLGIIVIARHLSTAFGFNDAMWAKYGAPMLASTGAEAGGNPPRTNPQSRSLTRLTGQGVHLAICSMATQRVASTIAQAAGGEAAKIAEELIANTVTNGHMVPAGIVAVSRAQERGYTLVSA